MRYWLFGLLCVVIALTAGHDLPAAAQTSTSSQSDSGYATRLRLARRYLNSSHRLEIFKATYLAEAHTNANTCRQEPCRKALEKAFSNAIDAATPDYAEHIAVVMATSFTETELRRLVTFTESPEGQSIAVKQAAFAALEGQLAMEFQRHVLTDVAGSFCTEWPQACGRWTPLAKPIQPSGHE